MTRLAEIELFGVALQQTFAFQQPPHAVGNGVGQLRQLGRRRFAQPLKARAGTVAWRHDVEAIEKQHMEVDVEIERRAEALDQGDGPRCGDLLRMPGLPEQAAKLDYPGFPRRPMIRFVRAHCTANLNSGSLLCKLVIKGVRVV